MRMPALGVADADGLIACLQAETARLNEAQDPRPPALAGITTTEGAGACRV